MERMGKSGEKYMPFVHSGNVETIVESVEINTLMAQDRHDEADKRLEIFRKKVDLNDNVNRQYVLRTQAMIDYRLGRIDVEAERVQLIEAFLCTVPEYREKKLPVGIYSRYEIIIFCNIAFEKEILQENKKTCKKLLLQAFFVAELNGNKYMMNHIKEHMRKMDYDIV